MQFQRTIFVLYLEVLYKEHQIENLYYALCYIENTGNTVIKDQYIRFEFPSEAVIIDYSPEPKPEPELGVSEAAIAELKPNEKRYSIGHIERGQHVGFGFVLTSSSKIYLNLHPFNEEGNVEFVSRTISEAQSDKDHFVKFIILYFLFDFVPRVLVAIPFFGSELAGLARLAILIAIYPTLKSVANVIAGIVGRLLLSGTSEAPLSIRDTTTRVNDVRHT